MITTADDRDQTIAAIKANLKTRTTSDTKWSVTGGQGTAWGWIRITTIPSQRASKYSGMTEIQRKELAALLGLERVSDSGESIPSGSDYRQEYLDRSAGKTPSKIGKPYWD